jgi:hypothetical protein
VSRTGEHACENIDNLKKDEGLPVPLLQEQRLLRHTKKLFAVRFLD